MSVKITPILGVVKVLSGGELQKAKPANNNTRWMFDVEGSLEEPLVIQLIDNRGKEVSPELLACSFLPRSQGFYDAKPFLFQQEGGLISIVHGHSLFRDSDSGKIVEGETCFYRVMIDVLHTATR